MGKHYGINSRALLYVCVAAWLVGALTVYAVDGSYYWQFDQKYTGTDENSGAKDVKDSRSLKTWVSGTLVTSPRAPDPLPNPDEGPFSDGTNPADNPKAVQSPIYIHRSSVNFGMKNKSWTLEGWFRHNGTPASGDWGDIIVGSRNSSSYFWNGGYSLVMSSDGKVRLYVAEKGGGETSLISDTALNDQQWHHFAITWDHDNGGATGWLQLYFDGVLHDEKAGLGNVDGTWGSEAITMVVGCRQLTNPDNYWDGQLDEFRLTYDRILTRQDFLNFAGKKGTLFISR